MHMPHELARTRRLLDRYSLMFRFSLAAAVLGALVAFLGVIASLNAGAMSGAVPLGLFFVSLGGLLAYKILTSTVRVLEKPSA